MNSIAVILGLAPMLLAPRGEQAAETIVAECTWGGPHGYNLRILRTHADPVVFRGELSETTFADHVPRGMFPGLRYSSNEGSAVYEGADSFRLEIDRQEGEIFEGRFRRPGWTEAVGVICHLPGTRPRGRALVMVIRLLPDPHGPDRAANLGEETFATLGRQATSGTLTRLQAETAAGKVMRICAEYESEEDAEAALAELGKVVVRGSYSRRAALAPTCGAAVAPQ